MLLVELINPPVRILPPVMLLVELINPAIKILPPVMLPVALIRLVTNPVDVNVATFGVPVTLIVTFPLALAMLTLLLPFKISEALLLSASLPQTTLLPV